MRKLMKSCPVPVYGLVEGVRPGHLHIIVTGAVEGRRPTDAKIGAGCCDQSVRLRQDQPFRHRGQQLREIWRKRSEEHTSELQSLMRISYAVFCLKKKSQH